MNIGMMLEEHKNTCDKCRDVMKKKNHDYTSNSLDPFANFRASSIIGVDPKLGVLLRILDKIKRIQCYIQEGELKVEGEGVFDAIDDNINYLIILKCMIMEEKEVKADNGYHSVMGVDNMDMDEIPCDDCGGSGKCPACKYT